MGKMVIIALALTGLAFMEWVACLAIKAFLDILEEERRRKAEEGEVDD